jgi:hypothetical protein
MIFGAPMLLDLSTSQEKESIGAGAFPRIQAPKKYLYLKLLNTCRCISTTKTRNLVS